MNKAVFLDRDGTINVEVDYLHEIERLAFINGVPKALAQLKQMGYKLIVVSNQSGIGRGYYTADDTEKLHAYMNTILEKQAAGIDAFYYCPHVEQDHCMCRKPKTGLIEQAVRDFDICLQQSYMVGDKESDVLTAINAGCGYGLLLSGHEISRELQEKYKGHLYKDLGDFAQAIGEKYGVAE
ncbi:MAG: D-glycero-beta-D-manno-heptose 1,7-bisphosphate 7-phosphatase [Lachnospiraceae bacterium]|nr:D-glycero-beta-D-manno-heptose 1,7-bisphosphate 7-phosphatase [Lachnospiraceae bacterium]